MPCYYLGMEWIFSGIGTLFLGMIIGAGGNEVVRKVISRRRQTQKQRAGNHASQLQAGRDIVQKKK